MPTMKNFREEIEQLPLALFRTKQKKWATCSKLQWPCLDLLGLSKGNFWQKYFFIILRTLQTWLKALIKTSWPGTSCLHATKQNKCCHILKMLHKYWPCYISLTQQLFHDISTWWHSFNLCKCWSTSLSYALDFLSLRSCSYAHFCWLLKWCMLIYLLYKVAATCDCAMNTLLKWTHMWTEMLPRSLYENVTCTSFHSKYY